MNEIILLYKTRGETPLACVERFRAANQRYANQPLSYLGRLDPMAEGLLVVAAGDANKRREQVLGLPKVYEVDILLGVSTDTFDVLGKVTDIVTRTSHPKPSIIELGAYLELLIGKHNQAYPPYSSKTVHGKALHEWTREGKLNEIIIPTHEVEIHDCIIVGMNSIRQPDLLMSVRDDIKNVAGDFRQDEILACWEEQLRPLYDFSFDVLSVRLAVSSGTYMRSIANDLGEEFSIPSIAYRIRRTCVGPYSVDQISVKH